MRGILLALGIFIFAGCSSSNKRSLSSNYGPLDLDRMSGYERLSHCNKARTRNYETSGVIEFFREDRSSEKVALWSGGPIKDKILFECNVEIRGSGLSPAHNRCINLEHDLFLNQFTARPRDGWTRHSTRSDRKVKVELFKSIDDPERIGLYNCN